MRNPASKKISRCPFAAVTALAVFAISLAANSTDAQTTSEVKAVTSGQEDEVVVLSPFNVDENASDGYTSTEGVTASRFNQKLKDIPQTIIVLSNEFIKDVGATDLSDVMPLIGGRVTGGTRQQDAFAIRGFSVNETWIDGTRDVVEWGGGDFIHVQQLEVIKGPATNLYGNPKGLGGIINRISKLPKQDPYYQVSASVGSYDSYHVTADLTSPLNKDKTLAYRLTAAYRDEGSFRDLQDSSRLFVAPVLQWRPSTQTTVTFFGEFMREEHREDNFIPAALNATTGEREITVPISRSIDEPWANSTIEKEKARLIVEQKLNDNLTARFSGFVSFINNPIEQVEFLSLSPDNRTVNRRAFWLNRWQDYYFGECSLYGNWETGDLRHSLIVSADYFDNPGRVNVRRVALGTIDLLDPVYSDQKPDFPPSSAVTNTKLQNSQYGFSTTYQLKAFQDRLLLIGGWRHDQVDGVSTIELGQPPFRETETSDTADSPRFGVMVRPTKSASLYYQYSETFQPQGGGALRVDGSRLDPVTGSSSEYGLKLSFLEEHLQASLALFKVEASGIALRLPPPDNSFFENGGTTTSTGEELNITYNDDRLTLMAGWVHQNVRDTTSGADGPQLAGEAENQGQLFARYRWPINDFGGLTVGGGVVFTGERPLTTAENSQVFTASEVYTLSIGYGIAKGLSASLVVRNVFDDDYFAASNGNGTTWRPGEPRTISFTVTKTW
ncbi:MAG: TonB-dependent siderophore receptor [Opitutaceae bacterium]